MAWVASSSASASAAEDEALWGTTASDTIDEANLDGRRRERDAKNEEKVGVCVWERKEGLRTSYIPPFNLALFARAS